MTIPMVIHEITDLIPSISGAFYWTNQQGKIEWFWCNAAASEREWNAARHIGQVLNGACAALSDGASENLSRRALSVRNGLAISPVCDGAAEALGYQLLIDPIAHDDTKAHGFFALLRASNDMHFRHEERDTVRALQPHLRQALRHDGRHASGFAPGGRSGVMIVDAEGTLLRWSAHARELLLMATDRMSLATDPAQWANCPALVREVQDSVLRAPQPNGAGTLLTSPERSNRWGKFRLKGFRLHAGGDACPQWGICIEHLIPIELELLRVIKLCPLSTKQKEVCWLIAKGLPSTAIQAALGISYPTLKEHQQAIYAKLRVNSREHLVRHILSGGVQVLH